MTAGQWPLASGGGAKGERAAPLRHPGQRRRLEGGEPAGAAPRASGSGNLTTREDAPRRCATGERWHRHDRGKRAAPMTDGHWRWRPSKARGRAASQRHHAQRQRREWGEVAARLRHHDQRRGRHDKRTMHLTNGGDTKGEHAALLRHHGQRQRRHKREHCTTPLAILASDGDVTRGESTALLRHVAQRR